MSGNDRAPRTGRDEAVGRLNDAVSAEGRLSERADASKGTGDELGARAELEEAHEQVAAREAWVKWLEREY